MSLLLFFNHVPIQNGDGVAAAAAIGVGDGVAILPGSGAVAAAAVGTGSGVAILPGSGIALAILIAAGDGALLALPITYYFQTETDDGRVYRNEQSGPGSSYRIEPATRRLTS